MIDPPRLDRWSRVRSGLAFAIAIVVTTVAMSGCNDDSAPTPPTAGVTPTAAPTDAPTDAPTAAASTPNAPEANRTAANQPPPGAERVKNQPTVRPRGTGAFPDAWFFRDPGEPGVKNRPAASQALEDKKPPPLTVTDWSGDPISLDDLLGKIVVVHFWAAHRSRTVRTLRRNIQLVEEWKDRGVVFIGVHESAPSATTLANATAAFELNYPVCADVDGKTAEDWKIILWPHYNLIDHQGFLRGSGMIPSKVPGAIESLVNMRDGTSSQTPPVTSGTGG